MLKFIKICVWLLVLFSGVFYWQYNSFTQSNMCIDFVDGTFEVEKGENFWSALAKMWLNPWLTKIYLKLSPPDFELQAGKYQIACGNIESILENLKKPLNDTDMFITFLEGWNIYDINKTLVAKGLIKSGDFVSFVTDCEKFCPLKANYSFISDAETLEGFLYPDTYAINPNNFTIETLVRKMLTNFQEKVIDSWIISDIGSIEILDTITLASIVQKEANIKDNPEELALIAGILKKRLDEGWQIGADATVCYAHEIATMDCTPSEVLQYLYDKNAYNTRQKAGLPQGPIANPEARVIEATVGAKESKYYYYLHDTSWKIHYGATNTDHEANKAKYLY